MEPEDEDRAIDGVLREYARTGSASDDEQMISEINRGIDSSGSRKIDNPWILGSAMWKAAAALAAIIVVFIGIQSIGIYSAKADPTEVLVYTQPRFSPGGVASVRALVRNGQTMKPMPNAEVRAFLVSGRDKQISIGKRMRTDVDGVVLISADLPIAVEEGDYTLKVVASGKTGKTTLEKNMPVKRSFRTMLSSDKPLYQPGQTIHLRALTLNSDTLNPTQGREIGFEIRDPKGNKVFSKNLETSDFGIAVVDFQLANQVNEGAYTITATIDDTKSERTVKVERYTLPKYKVNLSSDRTYYAPGDVVEVVVDSQYTFGKPVANATVKITAQQFIERFRNFETLTGTTDESGHLTFHLPLKDAFVGQPLNKGDAFVRLNAEVTDPAGNTQETTHEVKVTNSPIRIEVFPESGELVQNVANKVYIVTAYPDGSPAKTTITLSNDRNKSVETSTMGIASVELIPTSRQLKLTLEAENTNGLQSRVVKALRVDQRTDSILLRTDRAVYQHGDVVTLEILSAKKARRVFVDVVKNGRSTLTSSVEVENGTGSLALDLPADAIGTLQLQAYSILNNGELARDTKVIQVNQSDGLTVKATLDKTSYKPAEKAVIDFLVTGKDGTPQQAALSLAAVDEAVFALNDMQPGLEEMYFLIQEEILKPRYQFTALPQRGAMSETPVDDNGLIEADVIVYSAAEGTTGAPDSTMSDSFTERGNAIYKAKQAQSDRLIGLLPWLPISLFGVLFIGMFIFTIHRLFDKSISTARTENTGGFVVFAMLGAALLPFVAVAAVGIFGIFYSHQMAVFMLVLITLICFGFLVVIFGRVEIKQNLTLRRCVKGLPFLYVALMIALGTFVWAIEGAPNWSEEFVMISTICLVAGLVIVSSAVPCWLNPRGVKAGLLSWISRMVIALVLILIPGALILSMFSSASSPAGKVVMKLEAAQERINPEERETLDFVTKGEAVKPTDKGKPRVRSYFPETLLWQPQLLTNSQGLATLEVTLADSITTWRLSGSAVSPSGKLGSMQQGIRVFQDFFVDIDFPVELTQNDEVAVPIAIFNYLDRPQTVEIDIKSAPWFEFTGSIQGTQSVTIPANSVSSATCQLRALKPGTGKLTVFAKGDQLSDAVERTVLVKPDGVRVETVINGRFNNGNIAESITIPEDAIDGGDDLYLKIYPGAFSQVVEGMDSIFRMPSGCFEQTSSTTYPNILTLNYMRQTGQVSPELEIKALNFINIGYQRLLSYEVKGGGFDWFGNPPAHTVLTAYGLMEFVDMAKVYEIDDDIISRTREWLLSKQSADGTWESPNGGIAEGAINKFKGDQTLRTTAYISWAIAQAGGEDRLASAIDYLIENHVETEDPYTLALCGHVFHSVGQVKAADTILRRLDEAVIIDDDGNFAWWEAGGESLTYGRGDSFSIETTAMIAQVYIKAGYNVGVANKALAWLIEKKDAHGTWQSTQATVQAMRALLAGATGNLADSDGSFDLSLQVNGADAGHLTINKDNSDVFHLISLSEFVKHGANEVALSIDRESSLAYQIVAVHHNPRGGTADIQDTDILSIATDYSTTNLAAKDELEVSVVLVYNRPESAPMTLVDFGIPPGFDIVQESLQKLVENKVIERFTANGRQVSLYFSSIPGGGEPTKFAYRLKAKFPVKAQAPAMVAYQYYEPEIRNESEPVMLNVE